MFDKKIESVFKCPKNSKIVKIHLNETFAKNYLLT
jgi:hypothetical protein